MNAHPPLLSQKKDILKAIQMSKRPLAITGAGISKASGLPTIDAKWQGHSLQELFKLKHAQRHIKEYQNAYREMLQAWIAAEPNQAHLILAISNFTIITQNIDGLHHRAKSFDVIELHGALTRWRCHGCRSLYQARILINGSMECEACGNILWPDIVFEGEHVNQLAKAIQWTNNCDLLFIVGTQLQMNPIAKLAEIALRNHIPIVCFNRDAEQMVPHYLTISRS